MLFPTTTRAGVVPPHRSAKCWSFMILNFIGRLVDGVNDSSCRRCRTPHLTSPLVRMKHFTSTRGTLFSCGQRRRALPMISRSCLLFYKTGPTAFGCPGSGTHDTRERRSAHVGKEAAPQPRRRAQHNGARQFCSTGFGRRGILLPSLCSLIPPARPGPGHRRRRQCCHRGRQRPPPYVQHRVPGPTRSAQSPGL
jgi:hypothetical protein